MYLVNMDKKKILIMRAYSLNSGGSGLILTLHMVPGVSTNRSNPRDLSQLFVSILGYGINTNKQMLNL